MSTIYDRNKKSSGYNAGHDFLREEGPIPERQTNDPINRDNRTRDFRNATSNCNDNIEVQRPQNETSEAIYLDSQESSRKYAQELSNYLNNANLALDIVDDIVLKQYLTKLDGMSLVPNSASELGQDVILFKINQMVYEKDEFVTEKFISTISAMTYADCSIFLIVDGYEDHADFYLGVKGFDSKRTSRSIAETFKSSIKGQFPGIIIGDKSYPEKDKKISEKDKLLKRLANAHAVSSCVGVPSFKDEDTSYTNVNYVQGIEKLAHAMLGRRYTAVVLASNLTPMSIGEIREGYENLYSQLSAISTQQLTYSTNESLSNALSRTKGFSDSHSQSHTDTFSHTDGTNRNTTKTESVTSRSGWARAGSIFGSALAAIGGVALMATGIGAPAGLAMVGGGAALAGLGSSAKQRSNSTSFAEGEQHSDTTGTSDGTTDTHTENFSETSGKTATVGSGKNFTLTLHNKHVEELLKRIDQQLERLFLSESTGLWSAATYFFSYDNDATSAETGAAIFKSIMQGEGSGVETSTVNTWISTDPRGNLVPALSSYVIDLKHPQFIFNNALSTTSIPVENSSLVSSKELSMMLSLPRQAVPGFPVVEHASLAKEVVRHQTSDGKRPIKLGNIFDQGVNYESNPVTLDSQSLTQHVFVTGSTGCGKSETVYKLLQEARLAGAKFLIIEPAKGEYKNIFGQDKSSLGNNDSLYNKVNVFGTNPKLTKLLRINPFCFSEGVHVLEHIDRLTEIFNVCWPMYAAMPAVLKKAMLKSYENLGWNLYDSTNKNKVVLYPTFSDLLKELENVIRSSAYSEEVKSNYAGSLMTRVESLNNGLYAEIFGGNEIPEAILFDQNTIIDLSRVGSQETKSLIMGILIMRLNEYRMSNATSANSTLKHITVLEEAHNILKRTSQDQTMEGSNLTGKSVEMLTNSIAEMRTYGEGFIIVDQSPTSVDIAAIKNTNTKIIMRLPEDADRKIAGKSAAMKDSQIDEIAKLPTGVAVVYQNDWVDPVLCKINQYEGKRIKHNESEFDVKPNSAPDRKEILKLLLKGRLKTTVEPDLKVIEQSVKNSSLSSSLKLEILNLADEYRSKGELKYWQDDYFDILSKIITEFLDLREVVENIVSNTSTYESLDAQLIQLVQSTLQVPDYMNLCVRQSLMRDYSLGNEAKFRIYLQWYDTVENKIKQNKC